jgi:hypothetical protein
VGSGVVVLLADEDEVLSDQARDEVLEVNELPVVGVVDPVGGVGGNR